MTHIPRMIKKIIKKVLKKVFGFSQPKKSKRNLIIAENLKTIVMYGIFNPKEITDIFFLYQPERLFIIELLETNYLQHKEIFTEENIICDTFRFSNLSAEHRLSFNIKPSFSSFNSFNPKYFKNRNKIEFTLASKSLADFLAENKISNIDLLYLRTNHSDNHLIQEFSTLNSTFLPKIINTQVFHNDLYPESKPLSCFTMLEDIGYKISNIMTINPRKDTHSSYFTFKRSNS